MTGLAFLIPIAIGMGLLGLAAFLWSLRDGQYEDMDGAATRILIDEEDELCAPPPCPMPSPRWCRC
jgi:cbb3-type cytochrome oxidase maturation protein